MKRFIIGSIISAIILAVPTVASAHSGSVTCDSNGLVFHYNADFPITTTVTEHVNGVDKTITVLAHTASSDTYSKTITGRVTASATWSGGGTIPPTTLLCPSPVTPPAPPTCTPPDVSQGITNGILTCVHTVTVTNTITVPGPPVVVPPPVYACPKGYKQNNFAGGVLTCTRTITKIKTRVKTVKQRVLIPWCPLPPHKTPGVAG